MLKSPVPWFGSKRAHVGAVWSHLGGQAHLIEPFGGSLAVALTAPRGMKVTANDLDGHVVNLWRAVRDHPDEVAASLEQPFFETEFYARHDWLFREREGLVELLRADPDYSDPRMAASWALVVSRALNGSAATGRPGARGLLNVGRQLRGLTAPRTPEQTRAWLLALSAQLQGMWILCKRWQRLLSPTLLYTHGPAAVFLDPPYAGTEKRYAVVSQVSAEVRAWALAHGLDPRLRIVLAGGPEEHDELLGHGWRKVPMKGDALWLSPAPAFDFSGNLYNPIPS